MAGRSGMEGDNSGIAGSSGSSQNILSMLRQHNLHLTSLAPVTSSSGIGGVYHIPVSVYQSGGIVLGGGGAGGAELFLQQQPGNQNAPAQILFTTANIGPSLHDMAIQAYQSGDFVTAERYAQQFLQMYPQNTDVLLLLSCISFHWGFLETCVQYCKAALAINPNLPEIYSNLGNVFKVSGNTVQALAYYEHAVRLKPTFIEGLINLANVLGDVGRTTEAIPHYLTILHQNPDLYYIRNTLGCVLLGQGNLNGAADCYMKCLETKPEFAAAWNNLGCVYQRRGDLWLAIHHFERAIQLNGNFLDAVQNMGHVFKQAKILDKAMSAYNYAWLKDPTNALIISCLATVYHQLGHHDLAIDTYHQALALNKNLPDVYSNLGDCFKSKGLADKAEEFYRKALMLNSRHASTLNNLGLLKHEKGRVEEAIYYYQEVTNTNPDFIMGHWNLATILKEIGRPVDALSSYHEILKRQPLKIPAPIFSEDISADATVNAFWCLQLAGDWCAENDSLRKRKLVEIVEWQWKSNGNMSVEPFQSLFYPVLAADHVKWIAIRHAHRFSEKNSKELRRLTYSHLHPPPAMNPNSRLKIGYVSSEFGDFTVGNLLRLLVTNQRNSVEVFCYALNPDDGSTSRKIIARGAEHFVDLSSTSSGDAAHRIYQDRIQVLVNLDGYRVSNGSAMMIFALTPAPVQALMALGYPGTSGATYIQYIVTDSVAAPLDMEEQFTEKFAYLPTTCFLGYHRCLYSSVSCSASFDGRKRKQFGLPEEEDAMIFLNFDPWYKYDPGTFRVWANILKRVPNSVLWLQRHKSTREGESLLMARAHELGIPSGAIRFCDETTSKKELFKMYQLAHVYLDIPQYNGYDTVLDAIWTCTPVVTVGSKKTLRGRMTTSQLTSLGIMDLVAESMEEYENIAVKLGTDPNYRKNVSDRIWDARVKSAVFDVKRYAHDLDTLFYKMWTQYERSKKPEHLVPLCS